MPFSCKLGTPLSNFEANLNYKEVDDPSLTVTFPLIDEPGTSILAWTTTPWTLPSNLGVMVNPEDRLHQNPREEKRAQLHPCASPSRRVLQGSRRIRRRRCRLGQTALRQTVPAAISVLCSKSAAKSVPCFGRRERFDRRGDWRRPFRSRLWRGRFLCLLERRDRACVSCRSKWKIHERSS